MTTSALEKPVWTASLFSHYEVREDCFRHDTGHAAVYSVAPRTVFGFGEGEPFSQTRWRFA